MRTSHAFYFFASLFLFSCGDPAGPEKEKEKEKDKTVHRHPAPAFNADSCYAYIKKQVDFGPRVPMSEAHRLCGDWLSSKLRSFGLEVTEQKGSMIAYDNRNTPLRNIIASYKPESQKRILLCAHWDTRPTADRDTRDPDKPILGANDGGSGVAVLLEIARQLVSAKCETGIDIIFFDLEDYGDKYCLGSEYWATHIHKAGYYANYGVLLDMVGAKGATFPIEGHSKMYASAFVKKIWDRGASLGYSDYFSYTEVQSITDDHVNINMIANIPCLDIVHMNPQTGDFGPSHHRHSDNMDIIDRHTLKAVGHTVSEVIYAE
jgi:glutaminyl-peptide cyclotransferase